MRALAARVGVSLRQEAWEVFHDPLPNLLAGLTVAVVALPLALSFGIVAFGPEVGPSAGLWSAILAGFLAALFGGSPYAITGPTGVLAVFIGEEIVRTHGGFASPDAILLGFLAVALSGVFQMAFGAMKLARFIEWIPYPVITGFMNGIALIILWTGAKLVLSPTGDDLTTPEAVGALRSVLAGAAPSLVYAAIALAGLALAITLGYPKLATRLPDQGWARVAKRVPGSLLALTFLTLAAVAVGSLQGLPHIRALPSGLPTFSLDLGLFARHPGWTRDLVLGALALAAISSMDTLLTCVLADAVVGKKTKGDRELVAQGIANATAGAFGANQACGAAVRTMVNIRNGGRTRLAGMSHALFLVVILVAGASIATLVPLAVLAGILLTTGFGMVEWRAIFEAHRAPRSDTLVMLVTTLAVLAAGLIEAVIVGLLLAALLFIRRMTELTDFVGEPAWTGRPREGLEGIEDRVLVYEVRGPLFFGAASRFTQTLERADLRGVPVVIFRLNSVTTIDETGLRALDVVLARLERNGQRVILAHVPLEASRKMDRFGLLARVGAENVVPDWPSAVARARVHLHTMARSPA